MTFFPPTFKRPKLRSIPRRRRRLPIVGAIEDDDDEDDDRRQPQNQDVGASVHEEHNRIPPPPPRRRERQTILVFNKKFLSSRQSSSSSSPRGGCCTLRLAQDESGDIPRNKRRVVALRAADHHATINDNSVVPMLSVEGNAFSPYGERFLRGPGGMNDVVAIMGRVATIGQENNTSAGGGGRRRQRTDDRYVWRVYQPKWNYDGAHVMEIRAVMPPPPPVHSSSADSTTTRRRRTNHEAVELVATLGCKSPGGGRRGYEVVKLIVKAESCLRLDAEVFLESMDPAAPPPPLVARFVQEEEGLLLSTSSAAAAGAGRRRSSTAATTTPAAGDDDTTRPINTRGTGGRSSRIHRHHRNGGGGSHGDNGATIYKDKMSIHVVGGPLISIDLVAIVALASCFEDHCRDRRQVLPWSREWRRATA